MKRRDRFIWKADDIEVHRVTARAIAYDDARNRLQEVEVRHADPRQDDYLAEKREALTKWDAANRDQRSLRNPPNKGSPT